MKKLPLGLTDFREIISENYYFTDKTILIDEFLKDGAKVLLFIRPRRFGKTLNMSMMKHFFDIKNGKENRKLFNGLKIEKTESIEEQGKYPVIFLSFKDIKELNWEDCRFKTASILKSLYNEFVYVREKLNAGELSEFDNIWLRKPEGDYQNALKLLSSYLYKYYEQKVIILIDEYDSPIVSAYEHGYYNEAVNFFRGLYSSALKDNEYLQKGVMTGILRIAKEGIFSGLNNLIVNTILDENYSQYFGLLEDEVREALDYYRLEYKIDEVREWYDGYKFGKTEVYNPWSIMNYLYRKELGAYWIGTSDNYLINELLDKAGTNLFDELKKIFSGDVIEKTLDSSTSLGYLTNPQEVWQLLLYSGYLKTEKRISLDKYILKIPNEEIKTFFEKSFITRFLGNIDYFHEMIKALIKDDMKKFAKYLNDMLFIRMSYHDGDKTEEKFYHNLVLGMIFSMLKDYEIYSNREAGYGRYDISVEPRDKEKLGYIFEFKVAGSVDQLEAKAKEALKQIEEKKYSVFMRENGVKNIREIGIAFCGKDLKVAFYDENHNIDFGSGYKY